MRIEYDEDADALYVTVQPGTTVKETHELEPGIMLDVDNKGRVIGLEILSLSKRYKGTNYRTAYLKNIRPAAVQ